ncbi:MULTISPECIES: DUF4184 family protein [Bacteria]|uniref:DUF4184 family protein n=1 Tax=Bacteria TaxID=2 RepID=UPI003C7B7856
MPFTVSHAAVALPFARTRVVPAAVAVGAMTPDLPLFLRLNGPLYGASHDLLMLPATMIVAFGLLLVWWLLLRPAVRALAPAWLATRLPDRWDERGRSVLRTAIPTAGSACWLALALAVGVVSHIVWDAFTHEGRFGSLLVPALGALWGPLPGYRWLQYGTGALGLTVLAVGGVLWLRGRPPRPLSRRATRPIRAGWMLALPALLVIAWVIGTVIYGPPDADFTVRHLAYRVLPPACAVWAVLTLVLCVVVARPDRAAHDPMRGARATRPVEGPDLPGTPGSA